MKLVNVLISTYNGEKYIREQIESILYQSYKRIKIYVRDDGSQDRTCEILRDYEKRNLITLFEEENIGFGRSFLRLLQNSEEGDYWAFCDQDDIWDEQKIEKAVDSLEKMPINSPNMYFHNFVLTDENLNEIGEYRYNIPSYSFQMAITECLHMGFATVINREFRRLMLKGDITEICSHDWWAELIAMQFGNVYTDDFIGAKHRRLNSSLSNSGLNNRIKWLLKALHGNSEIPNLTSQFLKVFNEEIHLNDKKLLEYFIFDRYDLKKSISKALYKKRWRTNLASEIVVRFLMIIGRI